MLQPDSHLGSYRLVGKLGQGGMGEVWKAEDTRLGRIVAIKILPQTVAADGRAIARMRREARLAAQMYHSNVATIHSFEEADGRMFIVMELVEGEPLTKLIARGPIAEADVCRIGRGIADALAEAHTKGVVHRDIKPDNVIVSGTRVKVLDFGIAKQVESESVDANDPTTVLTQHGMIIGTVFYMSPEQALGKPLDARTDIFSLGVVLYEAVTGRRPFGGETTTDTITRIVRDDAPIPNTISRGLATIIERCMRKDRDARYATAGELAQALEQQMAIAPTVPLTKAPQRATAATIIEQPPPPARRPWLWVAMVALLALAAALGAFVMSRMNSTEGGRTSRPPAAGVPPAADVVVAATPPVTRRAEARRSTTEKRSDETPDRGGRDADDDYNKGVALLVQRQPMAAQESFQAAIAKDPHHARAHFRLGEMALFRRDGPNARRELNAAMAVADRLDPRERALTELGLAILDGDRPRARALLRDIEAMSPRDPDVSRFRQLLGAPRRRPRP